MLLQCPRCNRTQYRRALPKPSVCAPLFVCVCVQGQEQLFFFLDKLLMTQISFPPDLLNELCVN